jgi:hypothetical protein
VNVVGAGTVEPKTGGWREAPQIKDWKPPGLDMMDRLVDQQDMIDRATRVRELTEAAVTQRLLKESQEKGG